MVQLFFYFRKLHNPHLIMYYKHMRLYLTPVLLINNTREKNYMCLFFGVGAFISGSTCCGGNNVTKNNYFKFLVFWWHLFLLESISQQENYSLCISTVAISLIIMPSYLLIKIYALWSLVNISLHIRKDSCGAVTTCMAEAAHILVIVITTFTRCPRS